jgi:hypothetical protein
MTCRLACRESKAADTPLPPSAPEQLSLHPCQPRRGDVAGRVVAGAGEGNACKGVRDAAAWEWGGAGLAGQGGMPGGLGLDGAAAGSQLGQGRVPTCDLLARRLVVSSVHQCCHAAANHAVQHLQVRGGWVRVSGGGRGAIPPQQLVHASSLVVRGRHGQLPQQGERHSLPPPSGRSTPRPAASGRPCPARCCRGSCPGRSPPAGL